MARKKKRSQAYGSMFSAFAGAALYIVSGLIGFDTMAGLPGRWTGAPILWQIALGVVFLLLGIYLYRRLPASPAAIQRTPRRRQLRSVGGGRSPGAARHRDSIDGGTPLL